MSYANIKRYNIFVSFIQFLFLLLFFSEPLNNKRLCMAIKSLLGCIIIYNLLGMNNSNDETIYGYHCILLKCISLLSIPVFKRECTLTIFLCVSTGTFFPPVCTQIFYQKSWSGVRVSHLIWNNWRIEAVFF